MVARDRWKRAVDVPPPRYMAPAPLTEALPRLYADRVYTPSQALRAVADDLGKEVAVDAALTLITAQPSDEPSQP